MRLQEYFFLAPYLGLGRSILVNKDNKRIIPFFDYPSVYKSKKEDFITCFDEVCSRGAFIMQKDLKNFETHLSAFCGANYAIGVGNATDALEILLQVNGIDRQDEVIFCSHTMIATASAIYTVGAIPVPVEAGYDHLIDPESIDYAITSKTKAIVLTHLNGRTCNMDSIIDIAENNNLLVFEDAAQALGSSFKNQHAGTFGVGGCISFYPAKLLGCFGDGGAIICQSKDVYEKINLIRDHGRNPESGEIECWGRNSRLDNLQAAFLDQQLKDYQTVIERRRAIAAYYDEKLNHLEQIVLPPSPKNNDKHFDVFQNYEIEALHRDKLKNYLADRGIGTLIQWGGKAVHQFRELGFTQILPYTESLFERMLMLPMNMSISDRDIDYICDNIVKFY